MFDIFYSGQHKLNLFPHEQPAESVAEARAKSRTKFFWFVEQYGRKTDLRLFNWKWLPTPWEAQQTHLIPVYSQFENCLIHFCPTHQDEEVHHHYKDKFLKRNTVKEYWHVLKEEAKWEVDPEWVPNPYEPPYIYVLGNPWYSAEEMPTLEYRVPGATEYKYINEPVVTCKADPHCWVILKPEYNWKIDTNWAPNPFDPPYIYCFGNSWFAPEEVVAEYHVDGALNTNM